MPYRTFADEKGTSWDVWDVRPVRPENRFLDRRGGEAGDTLDDWSGEDRRTGTDRRKEHEFRARLSPAMIHGWLVFQSEAEKRRLAPIPESWDEYDKQRLLELWNRAQVIPAPSRVPVGNGRS